MSYSAAKENGTISVDATPPTVRGYSL